MAPTTHTTDDGIVVTEAAGGPARRLRARAEAIRARLTARRGALLLGLLGALAFAVTLDMFYPGFMSRDSGNQLEQARSGVFNDQHPILMALVWRATDSVVPGPFGMLVLLSGMYWAALAALFWAMAGPLPARALGLLAVGSLLPAFCCVAVIWKDTFMHAAMLAGLACLVVPLGRSRWPRQLLAALCFALALGLRHNAAAAVWPLVALLLVELPPLARRPRWLRLLLAGALSLAVTLGATIALYRALAPFARAEHYWQRAAAFDLAAISLATGSVVIDQDTGVLAPGMGLAEIRWQFRPDYNDALYHCGYFRPDRCVRVFDTVRDQQQLARLARNWLRAVRAHPRTYLAHKADMARRLLRLGLEPKRPNYYLAGTPFHPLAQSYHPPARTLRILAWLDLQQTWVGFSAWIYALLSCLLLPLALVRYLRGGALVPVACIVSGLSYLLSVLVMAPGPENRYTAWTILGAALALAFAAVPSLSSLPAALARWRARLRGPRAARA